MMGPKKLNEIRAELRQQLSRDGQDPIEWLQHCLAEKPKPKDSRVLESLLEVLQEKPTKRAAKILKRKPARR